MPPLDRPWAPSLTDWLLAPSGWGEHVAVGLIIRLIIQPIRLTRLDPSRSTLSIWLASECSWVRERLTVDAAIPSQLPGRSKVGSRCRRQHHPTGSTGAH